MKKFMNAVKFIAVGLMVVGLSACHTTTYKSSEEWQWKLWRVTVVKAMVDTSRKTFSEDYLASTKYVPARDDRMRLARVHLSSGWNSVIAGAGVPDNLEFSQLESGTIVDLMTELGPNIDYGVQRFTRILGVVCAKSDKACIAREKDAKRLNAVIDENPPKDISAKYGATYGRRLTDEEIKKYD
jgi:hypothetical protein